MTRVLFMGRKTKGAEALKWCLQQGVDVVGVLTDSHLAGSSTQKVAEEAGLQLLTYPKATRLIEEGSLSFDLGLSFVYWVILGDPLLSHPGRGIINFHPAPLPDLKGTGGYNMAILERRTIYGVSAHYVDAGIDTGQIVDVFEFPMDPRTATAQSLEAQSMESLLTLFKETVSRALQTHELLPAKPNVGGTYVSRAEMEALKRIRPGDNPDHKARAFWFPPYKGAQIEINGRDMTVVPDRVLSDLAGGETHLHQ